MTKKASEKNKAWEKDRRDRLNKSFDDLAKLLPNYDPSITWTKIEIIQKSIAHIEHLHQRNEKYLATKDPEALKEYKELIGALKNFQSRNGQLGEILKQKNIALPPFTLPTFLINNPAIREEIETSASIKVDKSTGDENQEKLVNNSTPTSVKKPQLFKKKKKIIKDVAKIEDVIHKDKKIKQSDDENPSETVTSDVNKDIIKITEAAPIPISTPSNTSVPPAVINATPSQQNILFPKPLTIPIVTLPPGNLPTIIKFENFPPPRHIVPSLQPSKNNTLTKPIKILPQPNIKLYFPSPDGKIPIPAIRKKTIITIKKRRKRNLEKTLNVLENCKKIKIENISSEVENIKDIKETKDVNENNNKNDNKKEDNEVVDRVKEDCIKEKKLIEQQNLNENLPLQLKLPNVNTHTRTVSPTAAFLKSFPVVASILTPSKSNNETSKENILPNSSPKKLFVEKCSKPDELQTRLNSESTDLKYKTKDVINPTPKEKSTIADVVVSSSEIKDIDNKNKLNDILSKPLLQEELKFPLKVENNNLLKPTTTSYETITTSGSKFQTTYTTTSAEFPTSSISNFFPPFFSSSTRQMISKSISASSLHLSTQGPICTPLPLDTTTSFLDKNYLHNSSVKFSYPSITTNTAQTSVSNVDSYFKNPASLAISSTKCIQNSYIEKEEDSKLSLQTTTRKDKNSITSILQKDNYTSKTFEPTAKENSNIHSNIISKTQTTEAYTSNLSQNKAFTERNYKSVDSRTNKHDLDIKKSEIPSTKTSDVNLLNVSNIKTGLATSTAYSSNSSYFVQHSMNSELPFTSSPTFFSNSTSTCSNFVPIFSSTVNSIRDSVKNSSCLPPITINSTTISSTSTSNAFTNSNISNCLSSTVMSSLSLPVSSYLPKYSNFSSPISTCAGTASSESILKSAINQSNNKEPFYLFNLSEISSSSPMNQMNSKKYSNSLNNNVVSTTQIVDNSNILSSDLNKIPKNHYSTSPITSTGKNEVGRISTSHSAALLTNVPSTLNSFKNSTAKCDSNTVSSINPLVSEKLHKDIKNSHVSQIPNYSAHTYSNSAIIASKVSAITSSLSKFISNSDSTQVISNEVPPISIASSSSHSNTITTSTPNIFSSPNSKTHITFASNPSRSDTITNSRLNFFSAPNSTAPITLTSRSSYCDSITTSTPNIVSAPNAITPVTLGSYPSRKDTITTSTLNFFSGLNSVTPITLPSRPSYSDTITTSTPNIVSTPNAIPPITLASYPSCSNTITTSTPNIFCASNSITPITFSSRPSHSDTITPNVSSVTDFKTLDIKKHSPIKNIIYTNPSHFTDDNKPLDINFNSFINPYTGITLSNQISQNLPNVFNAYPTETKPSNFSVTTSIMSSKPHNNFSSNSINTHLPITSTDHVFNTSSSVASSSVDLNKTKFSNTKLITTTTSASLNTNSHLVSGSKKCRSQIFPTNTTKENSKSVEFEKHKKKSGSHPMVGTVNSNENTMNTIINIPSSINSTNVSDSVIGVVNQHLSSNKPISKAIILQSHSYGSKSTNSNIALASLPDSEIPVSSNSNNIYNPNLIVNSKTNKTTNDNYLVTNLYNKNQNQKNSGKLNYSSINSSNHPVTVKPCINETTKTINPNHSNLNLSNITNVEPNFNFHSNILPSNTNYDIKSTNIPVSSNNLSSLCNIPTTKEFAQHFNSEFSKLPQIHSKVVADQKLNNQNSKLNSDNTVTSSQFLLRPYDLPVSKVADNLNNFVQVTSSSQTSTWSANSIQNEIITTTPSSHTVVSSFVNNNYPSSSNCKNFYYPLQSECGTTYNNYAVPQSNSYTVGQPPASLMTYPNLKADLPWIPPPMPQHSIPTSDYNTFTFSLTPTTSTLVTSSNQYATTNFSFSLTAPKSSTSVTSGSSEKLAKVSSKTFPTDSLYNTDYDINYISQKEPTNFQFSLQKPNTASQVYLPNEKSNYSFTIDSHLGENKPQINSSNVNNNEFKIPTSSNTKSKLKTSSKTKTSGSFYDCDQNKSCSKTNQKYLVNWMTSSTPSDYNPPMFGDFSNQSNFNAQNTGNTNEINNKRNVSYFPPIDENMVSWSPNKSFDQSLQNCTPQYYNNGDYQLEPEFSQSNLMAHTNYKSSLKNDKNSIKEPNQSNFFSIKQFVDQGANNDSVSSSNQKPYNDQTCQQHLNENAAQMQTQPHLQVQPLHQQSQKKISPSKLKDTRKDTKTATNQNTNNFNESLQQINSQQKPTQSLTCNYSAESLISKKEKTSRNFYNNIHEHPNLYHSNNTTINNDLTDQNFSSNYFHNYPSSNHQNFISNETDYLGASYSSNETVIPFDKTTTKDTKKFNTINYTPSTAPSHHFPPPPPPHPNYESNYLSVPPLISSSTNNDHYDPTCHHYGSTNGTNYQMNNWNSSKQYLPQQTNVMQYQQHNLTNSDGHLQSINSQTSSSIGNLPNFNLSSICPEINDKVGTNTGW